MAIYDSFPWTSVHELNLGWIIEQVKAGNIKIDGFEEALAQFDEDYRTLSALAAAFTIAGSNISTTKNFIAASLSGPLTGNVTGNLTGNVTGNVTGDVTGDVTGNADTATYATSAGSATTATNATNATNANHATTADSATTATTATTASAAVTTTAFDKTTLASTDLDDYMSTTHAVTLYRCSVAASNAPSGMGGESCTVIYIGVPGINYGLQFAWFDQMASAYYTRMLYGGAWQAWKKFDLSNA